MKKTAAVERQSGTIVAIGRDMGIPVGTNLGSLTIVPLKKKPVATKIVPAPAALPDLDAIAVVVETPEQIAKRIEDAKQFRAYAQKAVGIVVAIRARRAQISACEEQAEDLIPALQYELETLAASEEKILEAGGDSAMQERIRFGLLMEEIKTAPATKEAASELLQSCIDMGRFRLAMAQDAPNFRTDKIGAQKFDDRVYIPLLDSRKDSGQYALEEELGKYLAKVGEVIALEAKARLEDTLRAGDPRLDRMADGMVGTYVLRFPERIASGKPALSAGVGLVSIESKIRSGGGKLTIIKIVSGAGRLSWMDDYRGSWISFGSFKRGLSDANLEDGLRLMSDRLIRTLSDASKLWNKSSYRR
ncbi:MAG: hypothetical protein UY31_C0050G0005 [Candidatus Wolfebacteria bacterium GW2011_GWE1_48_7]|uniref:Uncharacterized protein n=2 Tax=Candidatus Wolfeibacteriota TaxID=1752735 RepID=A0A0G1WJ17_9BACT|nr:MAG: hypothetical protein UX70_C0001G0515 [Candidatus Wolfebacteria bacterium GW2011_GWB1_47_1]KKU35388.1 MAG: hypothetical protein UX49_C0027G0009 [Candidatus Wolfebacteria bacterium GW2011_GWC2_46_275]KKU42716.1 MAG: hypothetical protein UX58_C0001G0148 [Candidatus Wolfebacteria bacterium GW2011_GWB2_46_69]KKU54550.1 MAG: hypothetical protein UX76_C0001G0009 [Candidatus Wolfebacteria bacterium GW2011_GWC1_47_103]KKU59934.1 MAG: hypothetical protein UX83_C0001G0009 [Candidatus Wolfebacteria